MKRVLLFIFMLSSLHIYAEGVKSVFLGFSPSLGQIKSSSHVKNSDTSIESKYKSYTSINLGYEYQFKGTLSLVELSYAKGVYDDYKFSGDKTTLTSWEPSNISVISLTPYYGYTLNSGKRLQIPLCGGIGIDYMHDKNQNNVGMSLAAKARMKFYFNTHLAAYLDANARVSAPLINKEEKEAKARNYFEYTSQTSINVGIIYSF